MGAAPAAQGGKFSISWEPTLPIFRFVGADASYRVLSSGDENG